MVAVQGPAADAGEVARIMEAPGVLARALLGEEPAADASKVAWIVEAPGVLARVLLGEEPAADASKVAWIVDNGRGGRCRGEFFL